MGEKEVYHNDCRHKEHIETNKQNFEAIIKEEARLEDLSNVVQVFVEDFILDLVRRYHLVLSEVVVYFVVFEKEIFEIAEEIGGFFIKVEILAGEKEKVLEGEDKENAWHDSFLGNYSYTTPES